MDKTPHRRETSVAPIAENRYWERLGYRQRALAKPPRLRLASFSQVDIDLLEQALVASEFEICTDGAADLIVVVVDTLGDARLAAVNRDAIAASTPLFLLKPVGLEIDLGVFPPGQGCWACFETRHRLLDGVATYVAHALEAEEPVTEPATYTPATLALAYQIAVLEIKRYFLQEAKKRPAGHIVTIRLKSLSKEIHPVTPLPHCLSCGRRARPSAPARPRLDVHKKMI